MTGKYENAERFLVKTKLKLLKKVTNDEAVRIIKLYNEYTCNDGSLKFHNTYHKDMVGYMYDRANSLVNTPWEDLDVKSPTLAIVETVLTQPRRFRFKGTFDRSTSLLKIRDNKTKIDFTATTYHEGSDWSSEPYLDEKGIFSVNERIILGRVFHHCYKEKKQRVNTYLEKRKERKKNVERAKWIALYEGEN